MGSVERFEDLVAWQRARTLNQSVYRVTCDGGLARDYGLTDQMRRASVSVMANIAEGFERRGVGEFRHFLIVAKASCAELRSHLYAAYDAGYIDDTTFQHMNDLANEVARIINGLRASIERNLDNRG